MNLYSVSLFPKPQMGEETLIPFSHILCEQCGSNETSVKDQKSDFVLLHTNMF